MYLTICFIELTINLQIVSALGRSSSVIAPFLSFSWLALTLTESSEGAQQMEIISPPPPLRRGFRNQSPPPCCLCCGQRVGYLLEVKPENTFTEASRPSPCCIVEQKRSTNTTLMTCVCRGVVWVVQYVKVCVTVWIWINNLHEAEVNRCREENNLLDGFFFSFLFSVLHRAQFNWNVLHYSHPYSYGANHSRIWGIVFPNNLWRNIFFNASYSPFDALFVEHWWKSFCSFTHCIFSFFFIWFIVRPRKAHNGQSVVACLAPLHNL